MSETIFGRIIRGEIPARIVYEDEVCLAFHDVAPQAPLHLLLVPKMTLAKLSDAVIEDQALLGHLLLVAAQIARAQGHGEGFRIVINNGASAGQSVFHLHLHILAGRPFAWPPG